MNQNKFNLGEEVWTIVEGKAVKDIITGLYFRGSFLNNHKDWEWIYSLGEQKDHLRPMYSPRPLIVLL